MVKGKKIVDHTQTVETGIFSCMHTDREKKVSLDTIITDTFFFEGTISTNTDNQLTQHVPDKIITLLS